MNFQFFLISTYHSYRGSDIESRMSFLILLLHAAWVTMILVLSEEKSLKLKKTAILVRNQARILTAIGMLKTKLCW